jgi:ribosome maturation factor RimP
MATLDRAAVDKISQIASDVCAAQSIELVHSEVIGPKRNSVVRIFVDKPGGVTIEDCSAVSRDIERRLDADDLIPTSYVLEVSSPGIERGLYKIEDFERFAGCEAKVRTTAVINGQRNFNGRIVAVEGAEIVFDDRTSGIVRFPFDSVNKANLRVDLDLEFERR